MRNRRILFLLPILLAGCGGHGGSTSSARTGKVAFTVKWPVQQGRFVPNAANHIRVVVTPLGGPLPPLDFARGDAGADGTATKTLNAVVADGDCTVVADAYNGDPATTGFAENPLSHGTQTLNVVAGGTTNANVVLASQLTQFKVTLTDLIEGGSLAYVLDGTSQNMGTIPLSPTSVYGATVEAQNGSGASSHDLILFPTDATQTTLTAGGFDVQSLAPVPGGTSSDTQLLANAALTTPTTGTLTAKFTDGLVNFAPIRPLSIAAVNPATSTTTVEASLLDAPALASSGDASYATVHVAAGYQLVRLSGQADDPSVLGTPSGGPFALSAAADAVVYGVVGGTSVSLNGGGSNTVPSGLVALAPYRFSGATANYALSADGTMFSFSKLVFPGASSVVAGTVGNAATPTGFAVGYDPKSRAVAFYTIESAKLRRYTFQSGSYSLDTGFPSGVSAAAIAVDGNFVGVLGSDGTLTLLNAEGKVLSTTTGFGVLAMGETPVSLSMANRKGAVASGAAGAYQIKTFTY